MKKEEFDKIIESNPEAKFKVVNGSNHNFKIGIEVLYTGKHSYDGNLYWFFDPVEDLQQTLLYTQVELIADSVTQPIKPKFTPLKFPCCIATSEIKGEETLKKVVTLFLDNGVEIEEKGEWNLSAYNYYGVDYDKEAWFWNNKESYSRGDNESEVTVYTLKDLFPETEDAVASSVEDNNWIEWDCANGLNPPVEKGTLVDIKWRDGRESVGLGYGDDSLCPVTDNMLNSWGEAMNSTVVAYRKHTPVKPQEASSEVLAESSSLRSVVVQSDVQTSVEPFKVVKHSYYDVTIKGEPFRFTKEEANLLCTLLIEAIGEDYEPS
jgi:hypothetical protein